MFIFKAAKKIVGGGVNAVKGIFSNDLADEEEEIEDDLFLFRAVKKAVGTTAMVGKTIFGDDLED